MDDVFFSPSPYLNVLSGKFLSLVSTDYLLNYYLCYLLIISATLSD